MKTLFTTCMAVFFAISLFAQKYTPIGNSSEVKFSIKNFGLTVNGSFKGLNGRISFSPANITSSAINLSVDAATVNTGNNKRDGHLRKEEYLDVNKYPAITFVSSRIVKSTDNGTFIMEGKVTIKSTTKLINIPFKATQKGDGVLFEGEFKLNRRDFGVGDKSMVMSDNLNVSFSVFAK